MAKTYQKCWPNGLWQYANETNCSQRVLRLVGDLLDGDYNDSLHTRIELILRLYPRYAIAQLSDAPDKDSCHMGYLFAINGLDLGLVGVICGFCEEVTNQFLESGYVYYYDEDVYRAYTPEAELKGPILDEIRDREAELLAECENNPEAREAMLAVSKEFLYKLYAKELDPNDESTWPTNDKLAPGIPLDLCFHLLLSRLKDARRLITTLSRSMEPTC